MTTRRPRALALASRLGWYPLLLALTWFLEAYTVGRIEPAAAYRSLVIVVGLSVAITVLSVRFLGLARGSLAAAFLLIGLVAIRSPLTAIPFIAGVVLLAVERSWEAQGRVRLPWARIHETMTVFVAVLFAVQVVQFATRSDPAPASKATAWAEQPLNAAKRRDMYFLLADAHGREDVLKDAYHYDDRPFLDSLEAHGFDISDASRSNYGLTRFSLGSMFTASYLSALNDDPSATYQDDLARRTIQENPAFPLLRRAGYEVDVVSSGYEHLGLRTADQFIDTGQPNEFETALIKAVASAEIWNAIDPEHTFESIRSRTRDELGGVLTIAEHPDSQPRFVFAHLPVPHWPFVFTDTCSPATPLNDPNEGFGHGGGSAPTVAAVAAQTRCVDSMLQDTAAALVREQPDAVVVIFSDHGPDEHLDWFAPDAFGLDERSANLFAARTPGHPGLFADDVTLVNVLPTLFNAYLGTQLPLQPNHFDFGPRPQDGTFVQVDPVIASPGS